MFSFFLRSSTLFDLSYKVSKSILEIASGIAFPPKREPTINIIKSHVEPSDVISKVETIFGVEKKDKNNKKNIDNLGKKILWVEDDKLLSLILSKKISGAGFTLLKANNEDEAMKILENEIPDIMAFDILLPGINSLDLLQKIRTNVKFRKIPSIILSNISTQSDIERSKTLASTS